MIEIYTDGAYSPSRDRGGIAFVVVKDGVKIYKFLQMIPTNATNNRMEILSVIEACLWALKRNYKKITIYSDSMYVIGTMTKSWAKNKNFDLWQTLEKVTSKLDIKWVHIKGHSGNKYNTICDYLAVTASHIEN